MIKAVQLMTNYILILTFVPNNRLINMEMQRCILYLISVLELHHGPSHVFYKCHFKVKSNSFFVSVNMLT